ncbi:hypothetical protein [Pustulibacterium marinum]|nr:hypothetical protein [Pustulibacterium marinum]
MLICLMFQAYITIALWSKIRTFKNFFRPFPEVIKKQVSDDSKYIVDLEEEVENPEEEEYFQEATELAMLSDEEPDTRLGNMIKPINNYITKTRGIGVDFHILKDIIDRNVDIIEEEIHNRIYAPLYIGLAATMLGIILGLFSINFKADNNSIITNSQLQTIEQIQGNDTENVSTQEALNKLQPLLDGVKTAMVASVFGLICTTLLSVWGFKNAKTDNEKDKNKLLSLIQSELMPKMNRSRLPEIDVLANKLDDFAKNTVSAIQNLDKIVKGSKQNLQNEAMLLQQVQDLDIKKLSKANIDIFKKLESMMISFENFAGYYENLDRSLLNTTKLISQLEMFIKNTDNLGAVLEGLKQNIHLGNDATIFFNQHLKSFEHYSEAINEAIADTDQKMARAVGALGSSVEKQFEVLNESVATYDVKLNNAFTNAIDGYNATIQHQVDKTTEAFELARPKFEKLNNLEKLNAIDSKLNSLENNIVQTFKEGTAQQVKAIKEIEWRQEPPTYTTQQVQVPQKYNETKMSKRQWSEFIVKMIAFTIIIVCGVLFIYNSLV